MNQLASVGQLSIALERQRSSRPLLGEIAIREGAMRRRDVDAVLSWKRFDRLRLFGEIALDLGFLARRRLDALLRIQGQDTPPLLDVLVAMGVVQRTYVDQLERDFLWARWESQHTRQQPI